MLHYTESGLLALCDNGLVAETDECPCGCPPFDGRSIIYVDKHATGTGDGSSWTNAYTNIQTAINAHSEKEIQIQGYGESDCYPAGIILAECVYLKGVNNMWIDEYTTFAFNGENTETAKFENINVKTCAVGFYNITLGTFIDCTNENVKYGFRNCNDSSFDTCVSSNCSIAGATGFYDCDDSIFVDCTANNNDGYNYPSGEPSGGSGFWACHSGSFINCTANGNDHYGFWGCSGSFVDCMADGTAIDVGIGGIGFRGCSGSFVNCTATNNYSCGWWQNYATFITCNDINNCIGGGNGCTPGHPDYVCNEV